jgi:uncharacterized protein YqgQ
MAMKCNDVRTFFYQIAMKTVSMRIPQADMDFFTNYGYISVMQKEEYDQALVEVSNLTQMYGDLQNETTDERSAETSLKEEEKKTHSILFHFEGKEKKEAELKSVESKRDVVSKEEADIAARESKIKELIQKKSMVDRIVPYDGKYLALTGNGVITLNDLNVRNYRVSDCEFSDFIEESKETSDELRSIVERGSFYETRLGANFSEADPSLLWSMSIGLAKLQGDQDQISQRFLNAFGILNHFTSTIENKMMAAEVMIAYRPINAQSISTSDLGNLSETLVSLDKEIRQKASVPKQLSAGVATIIMAGRRYDGTYPTDRFAAFSRMTSSYESAAILSVLNVPSDQLFAKFQSFRSLFSSWGYKLSEDTELASAYLSISDLGPEDVATKMSIIQDALKNYLEYPLVASAILASIPTLEANETLDLMEKAYSQLGAFASGLERSELVSLSVRMIHGVKNEIVRELDPTAKITTTPVQFTYAPSHVFFLYYAPVIVAHASYHSTYSGIGGAHPAHGHGFGG